MKRREFVALLGGAATASAFHSLSTWAQPPAKTWRIGFIVGGEASPTESPYNGFAQGMREHGYAEGKDFVIEWRSALGHYDRFPVAARELIRLNVDVIVLSTSAAVRPVQEATRTVPIVMAYSTDPVGNGFVDSLSHPGGNITGLAGASDDISPKQIELLLRAVPNLSRLGALVNPDTPGYSAILKSTEAAARNVGIATFHAEVRSQEELDLAFTKLIEAQVEAVKIFPDALFFAQRSRIANLTREHRLPSIAVQRECAEAGALMSYGENLRDSFRRAAAFVDKILRGARPGDLPIEQSAKFELVLNLTTARRLGIDMPPTLLALADEVIE
ncbi:MAG: ABC transporter substrate-binding protein [Bradyrhizobiaceae bacterium]|nr:ABC transporter substrate-binding protein [Bradyrhizobiaceae bacterium]